MTSWYLYPIYLFVILTPRISNRGAKHAIGVAPVRSSSGVDQLYGVGSFRFGVQSGFVAALAERGGSFGAAAASGDDESKGTNSTDDHIKIPSFRIMHVDIAETL